MTEPALSDVERIAARLRYGGAVGARSVTYNDLAAVVGWDMDDPAAARVVAGILRAISTAEHEAGGPLMSAVVVGPKTGRSGKGFFNLAQRLSRYDGGIQGAFFAQVLRHVYAHWGRATVTTLPQAPSLARKGSTGLTPALSQRERVLDSRLRGNDLRGAG